MRAVLLHNGRHNVFKIKFSCIVQLLCLKLHIQKITFLTVLIVQTNV